MPLLNNNCKPNTPVKHEYWLAGFGKEFADPYDIRFTAEEYGVVGNRGVQGDQGTGSPFEVMESVYDVNQAGSGGITLTPKPDQMPYILPCLLGNVVQNTNEYVPAGSICNFYQLAHYDPVTTYVFRARDCVTDNWTFSASDTQPILRLNFNVEACSVSKEVYNVSNFSGYPFPLTKQKAWLFRGLVLNINSNTYRCKSIAISGNNNLSKGDFFNALTRTEIPSIFQEFTLTHQSPFDSANDVALLNQATNVSAYATFTSGTSVLRFDFPSLFARPQEPGVGGRQRIFNQITWRCQYDPTVSGQTPIKVTLT